jgi:60 kDa SS-A/Ro ribonucleoprotein
MSDALRRHVTHGVTPQSEQARPDEVKNNAGGYVFKVGDQTRLNRFLTLGTENGTYYATEKALTRDNAKLVTRMAEGNNPVLINDATLVSQAGRAPRNTPALFANAAAAGLGNVNYRQTALDNMPLVARTGYHLLLWAEYIEMFRGWGPQLVKGVRNWYLCQTPEDLAYQLLKYKQREGWSQKDLIRLAGFKGAGPRVETAHEAIFNYVLKGEFNAELLPPLIDVAEQVHETRNARDWVRLIGSTRSLSHEMLPSEALAEADVWRALIENKNLPIGAMLRNLSRLTRLGVLKQMDSFTTHVCNILTSQEIVTKGRIHPVQVLLALKTYASGHSLNGKSVWSPVPQVIDALDTMFYLAFGNIEPAGKQTAICLDVSGSMGHHVLVPDSHGSLVAAPYTHRELAAAMAMVTMKTEPSWAVMGFSHSFVPLNISANQRLDDVTRSITGIPFGRTDCALPMVWAMQNNLAVDTFQIHTDNETWYGPNGHPHEALKRYRKHSGIDARLQVIAYTPTEFSIADPLDSGQLDVSGFDAAIPNLLSSHSKGEI